MNLIERLDRETEIAGTKRNVAWLYRQIEMKYGTEIISKATLYGIGSGKRPCTPENAELIREFLPGMTLDDLNELYILALQKEAAKKNAGKRSSFQERAHA